MEHSKNIETMEKKEKKVVAIRKEDWVTLKNVATAEEKTLAEVVEDLIKKNETAVDKKQE